MEGAHSLHAGEFRTYFVRTALHTSHKPYQLKDRPTPSQRVACLCQMSSAELSARMWLWVSVCVSVQGCPLSVLQCMAQVRLRLCWVVWRQWSVGHRALQDAAHAILAHTAER